MKGDLHCHSKISDGSLGLEELILYAKRSGLDFISLTDHDSLSGVSRAVTIGKRNGIRVVPAVEISAFDYQRNRLVHIICYLPENRDRIAGMIYRSSEARKKAGVQMIQLVGRYYPLTVDQVVKYAAGCSSIFKIHIMHALMDMGFCDRIFGDLYYELFNEKDGKAIVIPEYPDVLDTINLIHESGGVAVMAHPAVYDSFDLLEALAKDKLIDGVEVYTPHHTKQQTELAEGIASRYGLIATGGTDFHGMYSKKPCPIGTVTVGGDVLDELIKKAKTIKAI